LQPFLSFSTHRKWLFPCSLLLTCLVFGEYSSIISEKLLHYIGEKYGSSAEKRVLRWQDLMKENHAASDWDKLNMVNHFFNKIRYMTDEEHWHQRDYWATPIEFLATDGGDCEDYAVAKYFTLKELGIPMEKLRITYVIATSINEPHMVLAYYETPDSEPLILDNIKDRVMTASARPDLEPVYGFNGDGLWNAHDRGDELKQDSKNVFQWEDLNERLIVEMNEAENSKI